MTGFLLACAALLAAALLWLGWPLLRGSISAQQDEQQSLSASNRETLQRQLAEAQDEFEAGRLEEAAFKETEQELARRLLEEGKAEEAASANSPVQGLLFAVVSLFVLAFSVGLYLDLGKPNLVVATPPSAPVVDANGEFDADAAKRRALRLREQLEVNAQQPEAWAELARLERRLGQTSDAVRSYQHAAMMAQSENEKTELQLEMVETFALHAERNNSAIPPMALVITNEVLERHAEHPRALWYGSMLAEQAGQRDVAIQRVQKLLSLNPPEKIKQALEQQLAGWQVEETPSAPEVGSREITVNVDIPDGVDVGNTNSATLFVYARPANGPKMPLAVQRYESPIFPLSIKLNDSMAMVQGTKLASYEQLEVVARISFTGDAISQPGDWFGAEVIALEQNNVAIGIDTLVE